jgi:4-hydroxy-2-oxoglutarate aldolase
MKLFVLGSIASYFRGKPENEMQLFKGIYPPIVTPFEDQEVSYSQLSNNIKKWNEFELSGYVILGSNGENAMLNEMESLSVIETAIKYIPDNKQIIIGAGQESSKLTVNYIKQAGQIGGNAFLVVSPHYYKDQMTDSALVNYYTEVADNSTLPIIIYNVPKFTGFSLSVNLLAKLSAHPNIIGMKDSSGNMTFFQSLLALQLPEFQLLTGTANTLFPSLVMGAAGGVLALANIAPQYCIDIFRLYQQGSLEEARDLQFKIIRLNQLTTNIYGIGGLKFALDQVKYFGGEPRRPLELLDEKGRAEILGELKKLSLI